MKIASLKPTQWFPGQNVSVKPHLRGWIHLVAAPLSLAASIVLTCLAPTGATKGGSAIYLAASLILLESLRSTTASIGPHAGKSCGTALTTQTSSF